VSSARCCVARTKTFTQPATFVVLVVVVVVLLLVVVVVVHRQGNSVYWHDPVKRFVADVKSRTKPYSARYVGSMVSDVHRTLLYGVSGELRWFQRFS